MREHWYMVETQREEEQRRRREMEKKREGGSPEKLSEEGYEKLEQELNEVQERWAELLERETNAEIAYYETFVDTAEARKKLTAEREEILQIEPISERLIKLKSWRDAFQAWKDLNKNQSSARVEINKNRKERLELEKRVEELQNKLKSKLPF